MSCAREFLAGSASALATPTGSVVAVAFLFISAMYNTMSSNQDGSAVKDVALELWPRRLLRVERRMPSVNERFESGNVANCLPADKRAQLAPSLASASHVPGVCSLGVGESGGGRAGLDRENARAGRCADEPDEEHEHDVVGVGCLRVGGIVGLGRGCIWFGGVAFGELPVFVG